MFWSCGSPSWGVYVRVDETSRSLVVEDHADERSDRGWDEDDDREPDNDREDRDNQPGAHPGTLVKRGALE